MREDARPGFTLAAKTRGPCKTCGQPLAEEKTRSKDGSIPRRIFLCSGCYYRPYNCKCSGPTTGGRFGL